MLEQKTTFYSFIQLVAIDEKIRTLKQQIKKLCQQIDELRNQKDLLDKDKEKAHLAVIAAKKHVDAQELIMKELDVLEQGKKNQLERVSGYKDFQSLQSELSHVQERQQTQERLVLQAWNALEAAQDLERSASQLYEEKSSIVLLELTTHKKSIEVLERELSDILLGRPAQEKLVPQEWLAQYQYMSGHVEDPVVPVIQNSCGSCFHVLTRQELIEAQKGALIQCKGCYRLLYLSEVMNPEKTA